MPQAPPTDWNSALVVVLVGLIAGGLVLFALRRRKAASEPSSAGALVRDLEARRNSLYVQLRELETTAHARPAEVVAPERTSLELEAARVLKALDETARGSRKKKETPAAVAPAASSRPAASGFLWGVLTTAAVGALVYFVAQGAKPRPEGEPMTGSIRPEGESASATDPLSRLREAVAKEPKNIEARLALVRALVASRDFIGVYENADAILQINPDQPEALSYQALVRIAMGQAEMATEMLKRALRGNPNLVNGYLHLALAQVRLGRMDEAQATIDDAARRFPPEADLFRRAFEQMKSQGARAAAAAGEPNPHESATSAAAAEGAPAGTATASGGTGIGGVIELDPKVAGSVGRGSIVFIAVREAGMDKGPPAAVKRLSVDAFPLRFAVTDADSMAGESLPSSVRIDVRVDSDGNAATREPNDPKAALDDVAVGRTDLRLVLTR